MSDSPNKPSAQEPGGLGRRRPRMQAALAKTDHNIRPWNRPEPPAAPPRQRQLGPNPNAAGACPRCGQQVERLAIHLRKCPFPAKP